MRLFWSLPMLFLITALSAQQMPGEVGIDIEDEPVATPFPLALVLEEAEFFHDNIAWQPDWPLEFPVDAFRPVSNDWLSITVAYGDIQYSFRRDNKSKLLEFPFMLEGSFVQVRLEYSADVTGEDLLKFIYVGENARLEVLEYLDGRPSLIRVFSDGIYSFVLIRYGTGVIVESWFDRDGVFLDMFEYRQSPGYERITRYKSFSTQEESLIYFDSRYLVTEKRNSGGIYSVHYINEDLPRYWNRQYPEAEAEFYS
ncbi:MAG: hypothetical protein LBI14_10905, partial [Treponema sp.]|nr:hypothetical protein [Treponema sp.]